MNTQESALADLLRALAPKAPLELGGVAERNVPGQERIWLRANAAVRLNEYVLWVGVALPGNSILPFNDHLFWFGDHAVDPGTWVIVFTGAGQPRVMQGQGTGAPMLVLHRGRPQTLFTFDALVPALIRPVREYFQIGSPGR